MSQILIVEDEPIIRGALRKLLEQQHHGVAEAESVEQAREEYTLTDFDLVIADLRLPGETGTTLIDEAAPVPVLIMTSYASLRSAVDAMKQGAVDYIAKPFDHDEMLMSVDRVLRERNLNRQNQALRADANRDYPVQEGMIGESEVMRELFRRIEKVAHSEVPVLIQGESGTGKELVARAIHEQGDRADAPLITVNCAALADTLVDAELFGHQPGAVPGRDSARRGQVEIADGGTLFLDEVSELSPEAQSRLLNLLNNHEVNRLGDVEGRPVNVRLLAASHRDLTALVQQGRFRQDLLYRLNVVELHLPPLRERAEDIQPLAHALLSRISERLNSGELQFDPKALEALQQYSWPGNVRELENVVERAVILAEGSVITPDLLALREQPATAPPAGTQTPDPGEELSLEDYFARFVLENQQNMTETELARKLGISRKCLWERRQRLGIPRKRSSA
jgi:DNA-binding NtrC family response regulator